MFYDKITTGFVVQTFDDKGNLHHQEFVAGDDVVWEKEGQPIDANQLPLKGKEYHPLDMGKITKLDIANQSETMQQNLLSMFDYLDDTELLDSLCQIVVDGMKPLGDKL